MNYFVAELPNRQRNIDHLPVKMQLDYLRQENDVLRRSLMEKERVVINIAREKKGLENKVSWLEENKIDLGRQIENLEVMVLELSNKLSNLEPISSISVKTLPMPEGLSNLLKQSSILSENATMKKQANKNYESTLKPIFRRRLETCIDLPNEGISVKVISSQNKRSSSRNPPCGEKYLKTLRSVRSSENLFQNSPIKSNHLAIQKSPVASPSRRKLSYIEKISTQTLVSKEQ